MPRPRLESAAWWDEMLTLKDDVSLRDLSQRYGVSINGLSRALKRAGYDKPIVRKSREPSAVTKAKARKAPAGPDPRSAEAQEWWGDFLARKDAEPLAKLAKRYGVAEITLQRAMKRTGTERRSQRGARGAKSARKASRKLGRFSDQVGQVPDAELAALAGVSKYQVTQYRKRHGIPSVRGRAAKAPQVVAEAAMKGTPAPAPAPAPVRARASNAPGQEAYLVKVDSAGASTRYVVVGRDLAEAAGRAQTGVNARYAAAGYTIVSMEFIGPAL